MSKICIGIDLGTTNSAVAVVEGGISTIIPNSEGKRTTPSIVAFLKDGERKIGDAAKRQAVTNPTKTVSSIKRFMGKEFDKISTELDYINYDVVNDKGYPKVKIDDKLYTPQEISAMIIQKMKQTAEDYLGKTVTDAVITVPAYFNDGERQATKDAGEIAGLNVLRIINEPTSAAVAYGLDKKDKDITIIVFDCGGGTHDISILELGGGVFEVVATDGDTHLGGDDFDNALIDWMIDDFSKANSGIDIRKDPMAFQRIKEAAEKAKIELSSALITDINLPYLAVSDNGPIHFVSTLTRSKFESLVSTLIERTLLPCKLALKSAGMKISDIDEVVLVGGSTRIPAIQEAVKAFFEKEPSKGVNPDEVVALGAAIQGGVLTGEINDVLLLDVIPLSLGIETMGGICTKLIESNTTIPTSKSETFSTAADNQNAVNVNVLQGERTLAADNKQIGMFILDGIPPSPRGIPQIEVTFDVDANGILSVTAKDKNTGKEQSIKIEASSGLSEDEINKMKAEAEEHAEEDKKKQENILKINDADSYSFSVEKSLKEFGDKIEQSIKDEILTEISILKTAIIEKDLDLIDSQKPKIETMFNTVMENINNSQTDDNSTDDGVVDVDFEEV